METLIDRIEAETVRQIEKYKAPALLVLNHASYRELNTEFRAETNTNSSVLQLMTTGGPLDIAVDPYLKKDFVVIAHGTHSTVNYLITTP